MNMLPVILWSDVLIWLLFVAAIVLGVLSARKLPVRTAWQRVGRSRTGMAAATVLLVFVLIGLLDSLHYRPQLASGSETQPVAHAVEVLSLLDHLVTPLRVQHEKTYSAPLATRSFAKETVEVVAADGSLTPMRTFPRLRFGGAHLGDDEGARAGDISQRLLAAGALAG